MLVPARVKRALLIVNPYSTQVTGPSIAAVENALRERVEIETMFTQYPGHATELAAEAAADSVDAIVIFSGDGTYNEALNGADGALPIGFLPGGGTSVLPRALGLSRDPAEAARAVGAALAEDRLRRITLGTVNGRRFSFSAGIGFDAEAVRLLDQLGRDPAGARPGDMAFARMLVRMALERHGRWEPVLEIEGVGRAAFVFVGNCDPYSFAGSMPLHVTPGARFEDGLAFAAPERVRRRDLGRLAAAITAGRPYGKNVMTGLALAGSGVRRGGHLRVQADGEDLGDGEYAVFEAHRNAVAVLV
jgi:diacylglycerol kinase family enzyme